MVMSRFDHSEGETAAFVTGTFLDLKEFDSMAENEKESARVFIKETVHSQLSCVRRGMWEQLQEWIPAPLRRMAQRHIHPVVPGVSHQESPLPETIRHEFEVLNELAWLLTWKHKRVSSDVSEEERHMTEKLDVERVRRIKETIFPYLEEKMARLEKASTPGAST
ncbi:MAG: hypothetical protein HQL77_00170 [Magnetococcales bacterium]|nr:hypothetical protein [Magnetococcales bacterium]MBF0433768.1 hypothetical protein [Magnetococcales bacterium]